MTSSSKNQTRPDAAPSDGKLCRRCGRELPRSEFCVRRASRDGLNTRCRQCARDDRLAWKASPGSKNKLQLWRSTYLKLPHRKAKKAQYDRRRREVGLYKHPPISPERKRVYAKRDYSKHAAKYAAWARQYQADKLKATPPGARNDPRVVALYEIAKWLRSQGDMVEVDATKGIVRKIK